MMCKIISHTNIIRSREWIFDSDAEPPKKTDFNYVREKNVAWDGHARTSVRTHARRRVTCVRLDKKDAVGGHKKKRGDELGGA